MRRLLLVRRIETEFDQLHRALQRGRELSITHERLLAETSKKEILLHCIVHDLSGPLSGVTGALDILRHENLSLEARRFLELGRLGLRQQANFISDLLDSFRAEMGSKDDGVSDPSHAPDMIEWRAFMAKYIPDGDTTDGNYVYAYGVASLMLQVLKQCGDDFSRANIMKQAANLKNYAADLLLPGITVNTSPTDYYPIEQLQLIRFNGERYQSFGPVIDASLPA